MSGSKDEVKLLGGWYSPFTFRVELALKLKGIPYETVYEDATNKSALLLQLNPVNKRIPVLVHNGNPISESLVIIEYLDEMWKDNPILPQHPYDRAMARFWVKFVEDKFTESVRGILNARNEEGKQKELEKAVEALKVLEEELKKKKGSCKLFGGDRVGIVDLALSFFNNWVSAVEKAAGVKLHNSETFPLMEKWNHNFIELTFVKESLPQQDNLDDYFGNF